MEPSDLPSVVARVNGREIAQQRLISRAGSIQKLADAHGRSGTRGFYVSVLDELIAAELLFQEAQRSDLVPSPRELSERIDAIRNRFPAEALFQATLAEQGLSRESMAEALRQDLAVKKLIESRLVPEIQLTEEEVQDYYQRNPDAFVRPEQVRASHIVQALPENASAAVEEATRFHILQIRSRIEGGEDFAAVARAESQDTDSADRGGDLGWIRKGQTQPAFEEVIFSLPEGNLSDPVQTNWGIHLIRVESRRAEKKLTYQEARNSAYRFLHELKLQQLTAGLTAQLRKEAEVEIFF